MQAVSAESTGSRAGADGEGGVGATAAQAVDTEPGVPSAGVDTDADDAVEDARTQRRRLAGVYAASVSALAAMVGAYWVVVIRNGGQPVGGDMVGHAAAAEWLRTLPWWDWRGWSDWFYGGQAIGVNYPPLGHAWIRFTHPGHGQMAAVALGLLVLLPWGTLRLARAVGYPPRTQRAALGALVVFVALSGSMHWILPGFHPVPTVFGGWPAMLATVLGLFCASWAARCRGPVACGVVAGIAALLNTTVLPGIAVVCVVLLATSGATFRQGLRWATTAAAAAVAISAWWLVPFLAGWERLVDYVVPLTRSWGRSGSLQTVLLTVLGLAGTFVARRSSRRARRLVASATAGVLAALLADLFGYLRPERWLVMPVLVAVVAIAPLLPEGRQRWTARPSWKFLAAACLTVFIVITARVEVIPLVIWLLWWPRRVWAAAGGLVWASVLFWVPIWAIPDKPEHPGYPTPLEAVAATVVNEPGGHVYLEQLYAPHPGDLEFCEWGNSWQTVGDAGVDLLPLAGLYRETSHAAEFIDADLNLRWGVITDQYELRRNWVTAWEQVDEVPLDNPAAAEALGARWYVACDTDGRYSVTALSGRTAGGVTVSPHRGEESWHSAAVEWWLPIATGASLNGTDHSPIPVLTPGEKAVHPLDQAASSVSFDSGDDRLTVHAETAGWAWLRVPWDPDWRTLDGNPVRKGGPGHLVLWANRGVTELRWGVQRSVDVAAGVTTAAAAVVAAVMAVFNRRRGFALDHDRTRPVAAAIASSADMVDGWAHGAARQIRRWATSLLTRIRRAGH